MTPAQFRRSALAMPGAVEGAHQGHPDFRVAGRVFASLFPDGLRGMVKVTPAEQRDLLRQHEGVFTAANGAWGRAGCTIVNLAAATPDSLDPALALAWQAATTRAPRGKAPSKRTRPRKSR